ncbi:dipeptide ABC transporter ATP-binding protein [Roseomonas hellenica]|uniref:Dipeptide ABC transporter ATP-binding protein n=1 Tax=Plastoroseomonas hellenica TaxID=2687306 RepID=A0ABS5F7Q1_9PROT|nr:dipeptide ABC transporter ATP-binding protein [Plastoroseomonas hellenica]MBR0668160.1 dipeptide ABC transporter ATP-binding protein [Plastoroseomonas hellenica]
MTPLLDVADLAVHFPVFRGPLRRKAGTVRAVDGVSLQVFRGETLALVGESGCGKSTLARAVLRLQEPSAGQLRFEGQDLLRLDRRAMKAARRRMRMVFQDPHASLNPRLRAGEIVGEAFDIHGCTRRERDAGVAELLTLVGLGPEHAARFPHEFSGGQRQRIGIARALALHPSLVVCDEPVSALDVSVQAQIVNLLMELQERLGLSYLFISHDLHLVEFIADRVAVMYLGRIVETAPIQSLYAAPLHPYTQALLAASPSIDPDRRHQHVVPDGEVPSPLSPPSGCAFHPRCPFAIANCRAEMPPLLTLAPGHDVRCWRAGEWAAAPQRAAIPVGS